LKDCNIVAPHPHLSEPTYLSARQFLAAQFARRVAVIAHLASEVVCAKHADRHTMQTDETTISCIGASGSTKSHLVLRMDNNTKTITFK
jgi:hypothetical protein